MLPQLNDAEWDKFIVKLNDSFGVLPHMFQFGKESSWGAQFDKIEHHKI
jgi:hypothetical protein